jgi:hypothetical protein
MDTIRIGNLLRAGTTSFVAGCSVSQLEAPALGALVRAPLDKNYSVYGLITDIHIEDDGLVRQLVTAGNITDEVMHDNRERRIVPVEMSVLAVGYELDGKIFHLLPPRPPLSLDVIYLCSDAELAKFTSAGTGPERSPRGFGYFRHILQAKDIPTITQRSCRCLAHWAKLFNRSPKSPDFGPDDGVVGVHNDQT